VLFANAGGGELVHSEQSPKNTLTKRSTLTSKVAVHRAEGTASVARGRFHHSKRLDYYYYGYPSLQRLQCDQSRRALVCS
jgi:hypothetical protein